MNQIKSLLAIYLLVLGSTAKGQTIATYAGNGTYLNDVTLCPADGGQALSTPLNVPAIIKTDPMGNVYTYAYGPYWNCYHIKKISPSGVITNAVGNGGYNVHGGDGGPAASAGISTYAGFCVDNAGNIYVSESGSTPSGFSVSWIRKVNTSGIISTIAGGDTTGIPGDGGPATKAWFSASDLATDAAGNIYMADNGGNRIRKINTAGIISTIAGTGSQGDSGDGGPATNAAITFPSLITLDAAGNIYIMHQADPVIPSPVIRKITPAGIISTVADTNTLHISGSTGLTCDNSGNVYVVGEKNVVKKISSTGVVSNVAGNVAEIGFNGDDGPATAATLNGPTGLSLDGSGNLYIADAGNYRIRKVSPHSTTGVNTINNPERGAVRIWPEPNEGSFTIYVPSVNNQSASIVISNVVGQKIKNITIAANQEVNVKIDAPAGMYFITTIAGSDVQSTKMIVR